LAGGLTLGDGKSTPKHQGFTVGALPIRFLRGNALGEVVVSVETILVLVPGSLRSLQEVAKLLGGEVPDPSRRRPLESLTEAGREALHGPTVQAKDTARLGARDGSGRGDVIEGGEALEGLHFVGSVV